MQGYNIADVVRAFEPHPYEPISQQSAEETFQLVLDHVGCNYPARDVVDERIIHDVTTGTAAFDGKFYEIKQGFSDTSVVRGIIDSQTDVGGWPLLASLPAPADSDLDGMPDDWEISNDLNQNDDSDRNLVADNGYTMLENYINSLVDQGTTGTGKEYTIPAEFALMQNYPNPFNPQTAIEFSLSVNGIADIKIYDITGSLVKILAAGYYTSGHYSIEWNGANDFGIPVSSGIYFCALCFRGQKELIKMQLIR